MMSDYPFLPFDVQAYLGSTRHLNAKQHGAYLLLLMEAWQRPNCTLPDDDQILSAYASMGIEKWATVKPVVMSFWTYDKRSRGWTQRRLKKERKYVASVRAKKRDAAASRWKQKKKGDADADADAMQQSPSLSPSSYIYKFEEKKWFGEKEIEFLEVAHTDIDIRSKLSEEGFRKWAFEANPKDPLTPARNKIQKLAREIEAQQSLLQHKKKFQNVELGDLSHLTAALDGKGRRH